MNEPPWRYQIEPAMNDLVAGRLALWILFARPWREPRLMSLVSLVFGPRELLERVSLLKHLVTSVS
jgi:hypothetical protein